MRKFFEKSFQIFERMSPYQEPGNSPSNEVKKSLKCCFIVAAGDQLQTKVFLWQGKNLNKLKKFLVMRNDRACKI